VAAGCTRGNARRCRPCLEILEDRRLLSNTYTVTTTSDIHDPTGQVLTLRDAINLVHNDPSDSASDPDLIKFNIPTSDPGFNGASAWHLTFFSALPTVDHPAKLLANTQPGTGATPSIVLDGTSVPDSPSDDGLKIFAGHSTVTGFDIVSFRNGIELTGHGNNLISGNYIGVGVDGKMPFPNRGDGVLIDDSQSSGNVTSSNNEIIANIISANGDNGVEITGSSTANNIVLKNQIGLAPDGTPQGNFDNGVFIHAGASNNQIGDVRDAPLSHDNQGNVISANGIYGVLISDNGTTGNIVAFNLIGTDKTGTMFDGNSYGVGILNGASGNVIGGRFNPNISDSSRGLSNVISGNSYQGVVISEASGNQVQGNYIGTDSSGTLPLPNCRSSQTAAVGLYDGANGNTIGNASGQMGNLISGNAFAGIELVSNAAGILLTGNMVEGNYIGTDVTGTKKLPNQASGVHLMGGAVNNVIGGTGLLGNLISGNGSSAVQTQYPSQSVGAGVAIDNGFGHGPVQGNEIEGNYIGTDITGAKALGNLVDGVRIQGSASGNRVGLVGAGNVISGNLHYGVNLSASGVNFVQANFIGTDAAGLHALANGYDGVVIQFSAAANIIGTDGDGINDPAEGNVISGNGAEGIYLYYGGFNNIAGNYIGTNATGLAPVPNGQSGVYLYNSFDNRIGTNSDGIADTAEGNVISGNRQAGVTLDGYHSVGNVIAGNTIGPAANGSQFLYDPAVKLYVYSNGIGVQSINGANYNTIGGLAVGAGNVISSNQGNGIDIEGNGLPFGAVAAYRGEGDANDVFGANNGTAQGDVTFGPGRFGQAFQFGGVNGEVDVPPSAGIDVGASASGFTLSVWIKPADVALPHALLEWTNGLYLYQGLSGSGSLNAFLPGDSTSGSVDTTTGVVKAGVWQHVALVYDRSSGVARIYRDGIVVAQSNVGSFHVTTNTPLTFGMAQPDSYDGVPDPFAGGLDEVGLYDRPLSAAEIAAVAFDNGVGNNEILGNYIGTATDPTIRLANGGNGVLLHDSYGNGVGIVTPLETQGFGNVIAGNLGHGILITGDAAAENVVGYNLIGTDTTHTVKQGNGGDGVRLAEGASYNLVGYFSNSIAYNGGSGIVVGDRPNDAAVGNHFVANSIFGNARLGIDLGDDGVSYAVRVPLFTAPNNLAIRPFITSAYTAGRTTVITATVNGYPNTSLADVQFYADTTPNATGYGEGEVFLGQLTNVALRAFGFATVTFTYAGNLSGEYVTAIASDYTGSTSEFAYDVAVTGLVPTLTSLGAPPTEGAATLTVNGADFVSGATVLLNGTPLTTTFVNAGQVTAALPTGLTEEGQPENVTVSNPGPGGGTSNSLTFTVGDAALTVLPSPASLTMTEGESFNGVVALVTDSGGAEPLANYTAAIDWGDGSTSAATLLPVNGTFQVVGSHTYAKVGTAYLLVTRVQDEGGFQASSSTAVTIKDVPIVATGKTGIPFVAGQLLSRVVASFSDPDPSGFAGQYTASINWGDGATTAGAVASNGPGFDVTGSHSYPKAGNYTLYIVVQDTISGAVAPLGSTVVVADPPLSAQGRVFAVTGGAGSGSKNLNNVTVATFSDPDPHKDPTLYTATIDWGDGSPITSGTISGNNSFNVNGTHSYAAFADAKIITVVISGPLGRSVTVYSRVVDPPPDPASNTTFVQQLYQDLLGRPAEDAGLTFWGGLLDGGFPRAQVVGGILGSLEYRIRVVQGLYQQLLHRAADTTGLQAFTALLGQTGNVEAVEAQIIGSDEYLLARGGGTTAGFLSALYQDGLGRDVDATGQATFTPQLTGGATRAQVAAAVFASVEYRQEQVSGYYQRFLQRSADDGGLGAFVGALGQGTSDADIVAAILSSPEYFNRS
jgi:parallel beta-helix repeat protein